MRIYSYARIGAQITHQGVVIAKDKKEAIKVVSKSQRIILKRKELKRIKNAMIIPQIARATDSALSPAGQ